MRNPLTPDSFAHHYGKVCRRFGGEAQLQDSEIIQGIYGFLEDLSIEAFSAACASAINELPSMPTPRWLRDAAAEWSRRQVEDQAPAEVKAAIAGVVPAALPGSGTPEDPRQMDAIGPDHPAWLVPREEIQQNPQTGEWVMPFAINSPLAIRRQFDNLLKYKLCTPDQAKFARMVLGLKAFRTPARLAS